MTVRKAHIEAALDELRPSMDADGFTLAVESIGDDGAVEIGLTATTEACMDCLVPDEMLVSILEGAIKGRDPSTSQVIVRKHNM